MLKRRHGSLVKMFSSSMAVKPILFFSLWPTILPNLVNAATTTTSNLVPAVTVVPSCAQGCFKSFIDVNGYNAVCGSSPTLQCLCSRYGTSGSTIGEGAVQCIAAEGNRGRCSTEDSSRAVLEQAYAVCKLQPSAVSPTLKTIVATLVIPTGSASTGPIQVSPPSTVLITDTTSPGTTPTNTQTLTNKPPASTAEASNSNSRAAAGGLNPPQIAGIVIGVIAGVALLVGVIICAWCARRKRMENAESGRFDKMQDSNYGSPHSMQISAPTNVRKNSDIYAAYADMGVTPDQSYALGFGPGPGYGSDVPPGSGNNIRPDTIGLALSPEDNKATPPQGTNFAAIPAPTQRSSTQQQLYSPSTPMQSQTMHALARQETPPEEKPALTLTIPTPPTTLPVTSRDSVVTEFAEDGEDNDSAAGGAQIWRPPTTDPQSATTYYVADQWGNWAMRSSMRQSRSYEAISELEGSSPLSKEEAEQFSIAQATKSAMSAKVPPLNIPSKKTQPTKIGSPVDYNSPPLPPMPQPQSQRQSYRQSHRPKRSSSGAGRNRANSTSSSVYSSYSPPATVNPGSANPMPAYPLPNAEAYMNLLRENAMRLSTAPSTAKTVQKPTLPATTAAAVAKRNTRESHASATTIADDDYEPGLTPRGATVPLSPGISPVSYPKIHRRPHESLMVPPHSALGLTPPGQPSPTLGSAGIAPASGSKIAPTPPIGAGGSSYASGRNLTAGPKRGSILNPQSNRYNQPLQSPSAAASGGPSSAASSITVASSNDDPTVGQAGAAAVRPNFLGPTSPTESFNSNSSLLAKRLGAERAAALNLDTESSGSRSGKWQRQQQQQQPPSSASGPGIVLPDGGHVPLPATPQWKPMLTPSRRGDDLFLSVG